ncbi:chemotaxis protein [Undibacterium fentianense]|uniref:Chemotaxis protein n=1 Tax=Undibacterium fentianense TaxID=2828728 RepID=A0A941E331_9BURK|nr:chemotaxis protein [Undibacterium fentianense]MBR7798808.1 chemotaxis protein [Undibacterium fentianense]
MSKKKNLGSQVKQLLSGVSDHGVAHLLEVETDLVQTTLLLAEAIEKLGESFLDLHASITSQEAQILQLVNTGLVPKDNVDQLAKIQSDIGLHINRAVTSLQFQDLTSQLISRTVQRSAGLRELLSTLDMVGNVIPADGGTDEIAQVLNEITEKLEQQSKELKSLLRRTVNQQHLDSGDIELF